MTTFPPLGTDFPEVGCALVFGGSGGIGAASAALLVQRGCNVVLTYGSRRSEAEQLAADTSVRARSPISARTTSSTYYAPKS
ncbi:hypothetical protein [Mycobacterium yunnanensis]|uniref:hypothetical protein n=1 Tax=Mycobacterium yunnanensis TaxID=368477 RepID=UPI0021F26BAF|nr:hypothetical protein [Mycobacterium yunnanensis]